MKIKTVILGSVVGLVVGVLILLLPMPFRSPMYWIQHFELAGLNRLTVLFFPKPYSAARDMFFVFMGLLHCFIWAIVGAMTFFCGAVLFYRSKE
jgi:hypothetical protein